MRMAKIELTQEEVRLLNKALLFWYDHAGSYIETVPTAFDLHLHGLLSKKLEEVVSSGE